MDDKFMEFRAEMTAWRNEMTELMRLNRPPPPVIDPSSVNGRGPASHQPLKKAAKPMREGLARNLLLVLTLKI